MESTSSEREKLEIEVAKQINKNTAVNDVNSASMDTNIEVIRISGDNLPTTEEGNVFRGKTDIRTALQTLPDNILESLLGTNKLLGK